MKRSTPLRRTRPPKRKARIASSKKRIPRYARLKSSRVPLKPLKGSGKRFPKGYDKAYRAHVASLPCLLLRSYGYVLECGPSEPAHVHAEATGVGDRGQLIPLCANAHRLGHKNFHHTGRHSFAAYWGFGDFTALEKLAKKLDSEYVSAHPELAGRDPQ